MEFKEYMLYLSKDEIIKELERCFNRSNESWLKTRLENAAVEKINKKLDLILDKQEKLDLTKPDQRTKYYLLEEKYKKLDLIFDKMCGVEELKKGAKE